MFSGIGVPELLIVLVIALIVLGPKKLPEVGRSLGRGMREFKDSVSGLSLHDDDDEDERSLRADSTTTAPQPDTTTAPPPVEEPVTK
jgi:sec-independent protein translocase protein TatA